MDISDLVEKAKLVFDAEDEEGGKFVPTNFPKHLLEKAPEISNILMQSSFIEKANRYSKHDNEAIIAQAIFKKYSHQATYAICTAAIGGSLTAGIAASNLDSTINIVTIILFLLGLLSTFCGSLAVYRMYQINNDNLLETWMRSRANAETERLAYFDSMSRYIIDNYRSNTYIQVLFMHFFKRYQVDAQHSFYTSRRNEHRSSHERTSKIGAIGGLLLALGSGLLGLIGAITPKYLPIAALGTIGAAILVVASRREELNQDVRNAERYWRVADNISKVSEKFDETLMLIINKRKPELVLDFVEAIHEQLSLEHRQWTSDANRISPAIGALEESIKCLNQK